MRYTHQAIRRPHLAYKLLRYDLNREICGITEITRGRGRRLGEIGWAYGILHYHRLVRAWRRGACAATNRL